MLAVGVEVGDPGGDDGFELDDWFRLVLCGACFFVDVFVQAWDMVQLGLRSRVCSILRQLVL